MIRNYFKIAWRNITKGRLYAFINITGLALSFCITVFLFLVAFNHLSYDSFHKDADRIFQAYFVNIGADGISKSGDMPLPLVPTLKKEVPGIESATRVQTGRKTTLSYNGKYFDELLTYADGDFFKVFSFNVERGNKNNAIDNLNDIVLSASTAKAVFGDEDAVGKTVQIGKEDQYVNYIVSAIVEDAPNNSSIKYDAIANIESNPDYKNNIENWHNNNHNGYIKISPQVSQTTVEKSLKSISKTYFPEENLQIKKDDNSIEKSLNIKLQALKNVHFDRDITGGKGTPIALVYAIIGLAIFILLIASFNFINLNIARSIKRAKEVGVRKTLGGLKHQIILQLWLESFLICLIGFILGIILTGLILPQFNTRFNMGIELKTLINPLFIAIILSVFLTITIFAGGYPAIKMSNFKLVEVLKGKVSSQRRSTLRSSFIVFQFVISALLISISLISSKQLNYLRELPTGFDKELVYSIPIGNKADGRKLLTLFENELSQNSNIISISGSNVNLGKGRDRVTARTTTEFEENGQKISTDWMLVDYNFLKTMNIPLISGRDFNKSFAADLNNKVLVTESMEKVLGGNAVGKFFGNSESNEGYEVIGVIKDFNLYALSAEQKPIIMHVSSAEPINYMFLKLKSNNVEQTLNTVESLWRNLAPGNEFLGSFLDENIEAWYSNEKALTDVFGLASGIAIFLSCLGLFAISLLVIELRTKEIGVRQIMGAGPVNIVFMLSSYFIKLIFLALIIALPLSFLAMKKWLESYNQRIDLNIGVFMVSAISVIFIALLTISYHTIKASLTNPIKSLRTE